MLLGLWLLLLVAQALELLVDLLRGLDSVGGVGLGGCQGRGGGCGCCGIHRWGGGIILRGYWRVRRTLLRTVEARAWGFRSIVISRVWVGWSGATCTRGEDEFGERGVVALDEDHVASCAVEQVGQNLGGIGRPIVAEDALVGDASGDLHAGVHCDEPEDLIET